MESLEKQKEDLLHEKEVYTEMLKRMPDEVSKARSMRRICEINKELYDAEVSLVRLQKIKKTKTTWIQNE